MCIFKVEFRFLFILGSSLLQDWNAAGLQLVDAMIYAELLEFRIKDCAFGGLPAAHRRSILSYRIRST